MTKYQIDGSKEEVNLTKDNFVAKGGEGAIHIIGDRAFKVCDAGKMIPVDKFKELTALDHPHIIVPQRILLQKGKPIGYDMRCVPNNPRPLAQILTKAYRLRENVTPEKMNKLVQQIADGVRFIHKHPKYLQVDGNEFNYMVTEKHDEVFFIDVNSYQTPTFPADAIMPSIRDWHVAKDANGMYVWTQMSDWYSFAVISFYMFTGIHPFKGRHADFTNMKTLMYDQMLNCKSVLDPKTQFPLGAVFHPFEDVIPGGKDGAFMQWYRAVFIDNKRAPAPKDFQATLAFIAKVKEIVGSNKFEMRELHDYFEAITAYYENKGAEVVVGKNVFCNQRTIPRPAERFRVGFTPKRNVPYACWLENEQVRLLNLNDRTEIKATLNGTDLMACEGRIYIQSLNNIFELEFIEQTNVLIGTAKPVASIMPSATRLYQGVAVQDMFGTLMFSIFSDGGHHQQVKIPELNDLRITEAKYERNVLMVIGVDGEGRYNRFVFRFAKDWSNYDVRQIENITPTGINFTVLPKGVCVCLTEEEKIEIFSNQKGSASINVIDDPVIDGDMRLCHSGDQVRFAQGTKLYSLAVKK
jgi:hypothetical protein